MVENKDELEYVTEMWDNASVFSEQQQTQWAENEALASGRHLTPRKPGRSSLFVPKIPAYVRRKLADFVGQFVSDAPVTIKPTITSTPLGAKIRQRVHNYYVSTDLNYEALIYNSGYAGLVYNYAPIYLDWKEEIVKEKQTQSTGMPDGTVIEEEIEIETIIDSKPIASVLPPENVRIDPSTPWDCIDEARYVGFSVYMSSADADDNVRSKRWPKLPDEYTMDYNATSNILATERKTQASPFQKGDTMDLDNDLLEIRYHFFWQEDKHGFTPVRQVTLGDVMVLEEATPLEINWGGDEHAWPFVIAQVSPKAHEQYAPALPEQGRDLQIEVNAIRNQRRDNVALILNPEKYVTAHAGVTPAQLSFSYPGKIVTVDNLNAIQWQTVPDVTATGHNEETRAEGDMDKMFSEGSLRQGVPGQRKESATAIQAMSANASANSGLDSTMFMVSGIRPFHEKLGNAIAQKAPEEIYAMAAREMGVSAQIDPYLAAVEGDFLYNVFATSQQSEVQDALALISNLMGVIQTTYGPNANYKPLIDSLLEKAGYDPDSIIPNPMQQGLPDMSRMDPGGMDPGGSPSIQPRAQFQGGGAMGAGSGKQ